MLGLLLLAGACGTSSAIPCLCVLLGTCGGAGRMTQGMQARESSLCPTIDVFLCFYYFQKATISGVIKGHEERPVVAEKPETMNS